MRHAVFSGTFDPPTLGHLNIIKRTVPLFDKVTIAIGKDARKGEPLLTISERKQIFEKLTKLEVVEITGLLADYLKEHKITAILRSIRSAEDLQHEFSMADANRKLCGVETIFLMSDPQYSYINSTLVREIAQLGGNIDDFVPPLVSELIHSKR